MWAYKKSFAKAPEPISWLYFGRCLQKAKSSWSSNYFRIRKLKVYIFASDISIFSFRKYWYVEKQGIAYHVILANSSLHKLCFIGIDAQVSDLRNCLIRWILYKLIESYFKWVKNFDEKSQNFYEKWLFFPIKEDYYTCFISFS